MKPTHLTKWNFEARKGNLMLQSVYSNHLGKISNSSLSLNMIFILYLIKHAIIMVILVPKYVMYFDILIR